MFNTGLIDFLFLCPIALSFIFGFLMLKLEGSDVVNPLLKKIIGAGLFVTLLSFVIYFKVLFSKMSIIVFNGLFQLDHLSTISGLIIVTLLFFIHLGLSNENAEGLEASELFNFLGLMLALNFSQNMILIVVLSEIVFVKALQTLIPNRRLLDLQGTRIRLVGLIFLLGSVAINYGSGNAATISFLQSNAQALFSADYLFLIGAVFLLAGLADIMWSLFQVNTKSFNEKSFLLGLCLLITVYKYSSAQIFTTLNELQIFIQWGLVLILLFSAQKVFQSKALKCSIKYLLINSLVMSLIFNLPFMFDGKGANEISFIYLFSSITGLMILFFMERRLALYKGNSLLYDELKGLSDLLPYRSLVIAFGAFLALSFPLGLGVVILMYGFKLTLHTGFYWVGFWALFSTATIWIFNFNFIDKVFLQTRDTDAWLLWRNNEVVDVKIYQVGFFIIAALLLPVLSLCFLRL